MTSKRSSIAKEVAVGTVAKNENKNLVTPSRRVARLLSVAGWKEGSSADVGEGRQERIKETEKAQRRSAGWRAGKPKNIKMRTNNRKAQKRRNLGNNE